MIVNSQAESDERKAFTIAYNILTHFPFFNTYAINSPHHTYLYLQTNVLKGETDRHLSVMGDLEDGMDSSSRALHEEARHAERVRIASSAGYCWLYGIIALEMISLCTLVCK